MSNSHILDHNCVKFETSRVKNDFIQMLVYYFFCESPEFENNTLIEGLIWNDIWHYII